ncbi:DUF6789 family protein [Nitrolancea hollandica]|uniref:DUF1440 domain-containing protein n=1 Tax=Nitrolancea hollandica Lb TaxID=1129897 RepID=I4EGM6_9BACT|nr:DUF6789 family protein [Nitrolancea hollandica]CCF83838.1 conserved membrane hypothetical protein [Nitrolancea hollandica Lb]
MTDEPECPPRSRVINGVIAGLAGAIAYLLAMGIDIAITRKRTNDLRLLAGLVPGGRRCWPVLGTLLHFVNGAALGAVYSRVQQYLPGRGWKRGLLFAMIENLFLWPAMIVLDRVHPDIKNGSLPVYNRPLPFLQEILRHAAYGVVLGVVFQRKERGE